jgi:hypothetical protein
MLASRSSSFATSMINILCDVSVGFSVGKGVVFEESEMIERFLLTMALRGVDFQLKVGGLEFEGWGN